MRDLNGDGVINDGTELFGTATRLASGEAAGQGFRALAELDGNGDGSVDGSDAGFSSLRLWVDADSDGQTDAGELRGLIDMGVASLDLGHVLSGQTDNGNALALVGSYTTTEGASREMVDVWFAKADDGTAPQISDLLAEAPTALPGTTTVASAGVAAEPTMSTTSLSRVSLDEELLHNQTPLI